MDKVRTWFFNKRLEWLKIIGEQRNQTDFAQYLGLAQPTLSSYETGKRKPGKQKCQIIFEHTQDPTIFDVCGFARPASDSIPVSHDRLPRRVRTPLDAAIKEINAKYLELSIPADSPEAESIAISVMRKHGFKYNETE